MISLLYSAQARNDLVDIGLYISEKNFRAADAMVAKIHRACERLKDFPSSGQTRDDLTPGIRHCVMGNYLIFYRTSEIAVEILRITHGARYLPELL